MRRECGAIAGRRAGMRDWLRLRPPLMPVCVFLYCLFGKGLIFSGRAGVFYASQRLVAESALSLMVLEQRLRRPETGRTPSGPPPMPPPSLRD
jgi:hypothetical protein